MSYPPTEKFTPQIPIAFVLRPYAFMAIAADITQSHWTPQFGVLLAVETLRQAGITRLADKRPQGLRFIEKRFRK